MQFMYRARSSMSASASLIQPCRPTVVSKPLLVLVGHTKHDGYHAIHVRNGRVRLKLNGADWTKRYPRIVEEEAAQLREPIIIDAEVVHLSANGAADFDALHGRTVDDKAVALAFDLLLAGDDLRRRPVIERKNTLKWVLRKSRGGIQYVEHTEG